MPCLGEELQHAQGNKHEPNEYAFHSCACYFNTAHIITQTYSSLLLFFLVLFFLFFFFFAIMLSSFSCLYLHLLIFSRQFHGRLVSSHRAEYVRDRVF